MLNYLHPDKKILNLLFDADRKSMKNQLIFILFCFVFHPFIVLALEDNYYFNQISLDEGLSQSTVKAIHRDRPGMLWIGTKEGLNRYDGEKIQTYYHDNQKKNSLPHNDIYVIIEDSCQNLWIGSGGALCRYDRHNDAFIREKINGKEVSLRSALIKGNKIYFSSSTTLYEYDCKQNTWQTKDYRGDETQLTLATRLVNWDDRTLLIGSRWKGLFECNLQTGELKKKFTFRNTLDIYVDKNNLLWVSEYGEGVFCFDKSWNLIHDFSISKLKKPIDKVMNITEYEGAIWLSTDGDGIFIYSEEEDRFSHIVNEPDNPFSLPVNSIFTTGIDQYSNLWIGTVRGGLLSAKKVYIQSYTKTPVSLSSGLSTQTILSIFEDEGGNIWLGTDGEGINRYNPQSRKFTHFPNTYGKKISGISKFSSNRLLLSIYKEGLALFDKNTGNLTPFSLYDQTGTSLSLNTWIGYGVMNKETGQIYISDDHIFSYSVETGITTRLGQTRAGTGAIRLFDSKNLPGHVLICSNTAILQLDLETNRIEDIYRQDKNDSRVITAVDRDEYGTWWIGTEDGLYSWETEKKELKRYFGNRIKPVSSIIADNNGSLWIGSGLKLFRYRIPEKELFFYGKSEGVSPNEYLPKSRLLARSGDIYMGGVNGFIRISRHIPPIEEEKPTFELLDIRLDGSLLPGHKIENKNGLQKIKLPWNHTSLTVNLFINTKDLNPKTQYRYCLSGLSNSYREIDRQSIHLSTLPNGTYILQLEHEQADGQWSEPVSLLEITVLPPWWKTGWFISLMVLLATGAIIWFRQAAVHKTRRTMELEMQRRERDLSEQKVRFLINVSHELRTPLTLIYSPLQRLLNQKDLPDPLREILTLMYKHVKTTKNTINMVLDVRKMEKSPIALTFQTQNLNQWIKSVGEDFQLEFSAKNIRSVYRLDERIADFNFNEETCEKILSNLIMNAIKFSEDNSVIEIRTRQNKDNVRISVLDEGPGIPEEEAVHLFTRFYQGTHQKGGTGIGLSYAKTLVEQHGGNIGYEPGNPKGAVFWFELPFNPNNQSSHTSFEQIIGKEKNNFPDFDPEVDFKSMKEYTILIAEDQPDLLNYMKTSLSPYFRKVIPTNNGKEALDKIKSYIPDIVVSDIMMPEADGFELCRKIKTDIEISHIPVVLLTALGDEENTLKGYKTGADIYLAKPFAIDLLLSLLNNLFATRNILKKRYTQTTGPITPQEITFSNADEQFLSKLTRLLEENLHTPDVNMDLFAKEMAMSRATFYNKVKAVTGMSANTFFIHFKIKKACLLLQNPKLSINDIALEVGFNNQRYFSTVFKQITGKTPTRYRLEGKRGN